MQARQYAIAMWALLIPMHALGQHAGELRKCVSRNGAVSFQQEPCAAGGRQVSTRAYVAEPAPTAEQVHARAARERAARAESAELSRRAGTSAASHRAAGAGTLHRVTIAKDDATCQRARRHREDTLERVGLDRTYDLLRSLNDAVAQACR